jgi:hypothetical protein
MMKNTTFENCLVNVLGDSFKILNYKYSDCCFFKNRVDGFRNIVSFDFDEKNSFRVFVGIDYPYDVEFVENVPPEGARLYRFFTGGSLSDLPRDITFKNASHLEAQLERFRDYFSENINNDFFCLANTPEDYADNLTEVECIVKYEIYKREAIIDKAVREARVILESYREMSDIPKIRKFIDDDVKVYLKSNG